MTTIRAGRTDEVTRSSGDWLFVDVGFSNNSKSCGVLCEGNEPKELTFSQTKTCLVQLVTASTRPLNIVLEAPLSVAFSETGNPDGRAIERRDNKSRY